MRLESWAVMNDDNAHHEHRPIFLTGWEGVVFELEDDVPERHPPGFGSELSTAAIAP